MTAAESILGESRLAGLVKDVEAGRPVDLKKAALLQALDLARLGEQFALEAIQAENDADAEFRRQLAP